MSDHDRITILLSRRLAGELSPAEAEELRLALEQDPTLQALLSAVDGVTDAPSKGVTAREERQMLERGLRQWRLRAAGLHVARGEEGEDAVREDANVVHRLPGRIRRARIYRWSAAAAVVILAGLGIYQYNKGGKQPAQTPVTYREVAAKFGTRSYVDLPDGSRLWLNAGSKVRYAEGFATGVRELTLSGEGFFDVKHDPGQPFLIHAGGLDVKVLGTSLNVRAYPGDSIIETTLIQGKAEIDLPGKKASPIVLRESEKVTMWSDSVAGDDQAGGQTPGTKGGAAGNAGSNNAGATAADKDKEARPKFKRHSVTEDSTYKTIIETSWVEDKLIFRNEPFREVAVKLERWYNIRIHFESDKYMGQSMTGYFKDQPIKNVMDALQLLLGFHYEIAGDSILIK